MRRRLRTMMTAAMQGAGAAAAFSPSDEATLFIWWKSYAGVYEDAAKTTPATDDADLVGALEGQGETGIDATNTVQRPTLQNAPGDLVNGLPVIRADGLDDNLVATFTTLEQPFTVFILGKSNSQNGSTFFDKKTNTGSGCTMFRITSPSDVFRMFAGDTNLDIAADNSFHVFTCLFNGASSVFRMDGGNEQTGDAGDNSLLDGLNLFENRALSANLNGEVIEFIVCSSALSSARYQQFETYLMEVGGINP